MNLNLCIDFTLKTVFIFNTPTMTNLIEMFSNINDKVD